MRYQTLFSLLFVIATFRSIANPGVDSTAIIRIGGIQQFISIKSKDITKPLLLFLHGGPGGSVMDVSDTFTSQLQDHFIVVQWDQRETGKTLALNTSPQPLSIALMQTDTQVMIDSLLKKFRQKKIYLVGHSWGTVLGFYMAQNYPEQLYAFIAVSPYIDPFRSESMALELLKKVAIKTNNTQELRELSAVQVPFKNWEQMFVARKWLFAYDGHPIADADTAEVKKYVKTLESTWGHVWDEMAQLNFIKRMPSFRCPIYFFIGKKDYQTNFEIAAEYYSKLIAPKKKLFWFENSGHLVPTAEPKLFQEVIIKEILPQTF